MKRKVFYLCVFGLTIFGFTGCGSPVGNDKGGKEPAMRSMDTTVNARKNQRSMDSIAEAIWIKK